MLLLLVVGVFLVQLTIISQLFIPAVYMLPRQWAFWWYEQLLHLPRPHHGWWPGTFPGSSGRNWADLRWNGHFPGWCRCLTSAICGTSDRLLFCFLFITCTTLELKSANPERQKLGPCRSLPGAGMKCCREHRETQWLAGGWQPHQDPQVSWCPLWRTPFPLSLCRHTAEARLSATGWLRSPPGLPLAPSKASESYPYRWEQRQAWTSWVFIAVVGALWLHVICSLKLAVSFMLKCTKMLSSLF